MQFEKKGKGKKISSQSGGKAGSTFEVIYGNEAVDERPLLFAPKQNNIRKRGKFKKKKSRFSKKNVLK